MKIFPRLVARVKSIFANSRFVSAYLKNHRVRILVGLFVSFIINSVYVVFNAIYGIINKNLWLITVSVYYTLLAALRYTVLRAGGDGGSLYREYRAAAIGGAIVIAISLAMSGMMVYSAISLRSLHYSALLIAVLSVYSFYSLTRGVFGIRKSRNDGIPTHRAAYTIQLTSAITSIFNLRLATVEVAAYEERELTLFLSVAISFSVFSLGAFLARYGILGMRISKK